VSLTIGSGSSALFQSVQGRRECSKVASSAALRNPIGRSDVELTMSQRRVSQTQFVGTFSRVGIFAIAGVL
jgi:hypothetical protein